VREATVKEEISSYHARGGSPIRSKVSSINENVIY